MNNPQLTPYVCTGLVHRLNGSGLCLNAQLKR